MTPNPYETPESDLLSDGEGGANQLDLPVRGRIPIAARFACPFFLWLVLSVWFAYDGWLTTDPETMEYRTFNRVGTGVLVLVGVWLIPMIQRVHRSAVAQTPSRSLLLFVSPDRKEIVAATTPWLWGFGTIGLNLIPHGLARLGILLFAGRQALNPIAIAVESQLPYPLPIALAAEEQVDLLWTLNTVFGGILLIAIGVCSAGWIRRSYARRGFTELRLD